MFDLKFKNLTTTRGARATVLTMAYAFIAIVMTHPLWLHLRSHALAGTEDGSMSIWNLWWIKFSLFDLGQNPLESNYLFFPDGASLSFHSIPKFIGIISIPLQYLGGITFAYNFVVLLAFVLTGLTTYWLVYHLLGDRLAAFLAGVVFSYAPFHWGHFGHLQLLATMLIPVYILLIIKGREELKSSGLRPWILFSLAGVALAMIAYDTEYYAAFLVIFTALFLAYYFPFKWSRARFYVWGKLLIGLLISGIVSLILFSPMLLAIKRELAVNGDYVTFTAQQTSLYSRDFLSFFIPPDNSLFLGSLFASFTGESGIDVVYLGFLPLVLALSGIWWFRKRKDTWLWVLSAIVFAALALGPYMRIGHKTIAHISPYLIITKIPILSSLRVPARFTLFTMLAVSILAAYGFSALLGKLRKGKWMNITVPLATALLLLGIYIEYQPDLYEMSIKAPPVYSEIASSDIPGSVISLPLGWEGGADTVGLERTYTELFQIEHQRPMVGGMLARVPKDQLYEKAYTPVLDFLADPVNLTPSDLDKDPGAIMRFQNRYQVAFIVAHKRSPQIYDDGKYVYLDPDFTPEALERIDKYVIEYLDMEKFAETEEIVAYRRS